MNEIQSEWYLFMLPIAITPALLLSFCFLKFVIPRWFKIFEENHGNNE
tara:strand:+ start:274 stop:417 length:144 start_codon:yes stop_codon:yes gene_type:complete